MVREAINEHNIQGYLGWDIAITQTGPVLIEINSNPSTVLLTASYLPDKIGMKHMLAKYL